MKKKGIVIILVVVIIIAIVGGGTGIFKDGYIKVTDWFNTNIVDPTPTPTPTAYVSGTPSGWRNTTSTFNGWGGNIGKPQNIEMVAFPIRARDTEITTIRVWLNKNSKDGEVIYNTELTVSIEPEEETYVQVAIPTAYANTEEDELFFAYQANAYCDMQMVTGGPTTPYNLCYAYNGTFRDVENMVTCKDEELNLTNFYRLYIISGTTAEVNDYIIYLSEDNETAQTAVYAITSGLYGVVGNDVNIYKDNLIVDDYNSYDIKFSNISVGNNNTREYNLNPAIEGNINGKVEIYDLLSNKLYEQSINVLIAPENSGAGETKKVLCIGDSTTNAGVITSELLNLFSNDDMDIELLGTRGTDTNLHEGRGGWTANTYLNTESASGIINPFYNPTTETFDFNYYLTENTIDTPDYVIINLGINDMFAQTTDSGMETTATAVLDRLNTIIGNIHDYSSDIQIGLCVTIPPCYEQQAFGDDYGVGQTRQRYKKNIVYFASEMIKRYKDSTTVSLVPINVNLDTEYNFGTETIAVNSRNEQTITVQNSGVHPASSGYYQIADSYYYWLKNNV